MMTPKFNIGDRVSTIPEGQVNSTHKKIGVFNIGCLAFKSSVITDRIFDDGEYWYQRYNSHNWYNESGLIRVYEEIKDYEIY